MARQRALISILAGVVVATGCRADRQVAASILDDWGRPVVLAAPARRIVSLAPATTELVFALGLGGRLVGRTTWCAYPAEARAVADVGNGIGPNVEAVAAQRPDLVLLYASEANRAALERFEALGMSVAVIRLDLAADLRRAARLIGRLAGESAAAEVLIASFDSALSAASRAAVPAPRLAARIYVDIEGNPPLTLGSGSYVTEIIRAAGAENVFADLPQPSAVVSLEAIVAREPDFVLAISSDTLRRRASIASRPGWRALRAVREGRIVVAPGELYGQPSPRMPLAVRDLRERIAVPWNGGSDAPRRRGEAAPRG